MYTAVAIRLQNQIDKAKRNGRKLSYEDAYEKVVADSCETFLRDSGLFDKLLRLAEKDMSLFEKTKKYISELFDRVAGLKKEYNAFRPDSIESEIVNGMTDTIKQLHKLWEDAAITALENSRKASNTGKSNAESKVKNNSGTKQKNTADSGGVKYQLREHNVANSYQGYNEPITAEDVSFLRSIGKKSINDFVSNDIKKAKKWAYKFHQELGTKSPFFRAWFGDWRAYETQRIDVVDTVGDSRSNVKNIDTGWNIICSRKAHKETSNQSGSTQKNAVKYLKYIDDITKKALLFDSVISNKDNPNSLMFHNMYAYTEIFGYPALLRLRVEELYSYGDDGSKIFKRNYILQSIEEESVSESNRLSKPNQSKTNSSVISISDLFELVKQYDKSFNPVLVNKELLNSDGTPKLLYHQTENDFTEFDINMKGAGTRDNEVPFGIFLKDTDRDIGIKGKNKCSYMPICVIR